jgi:hypothetical protein
MKFCRDICFSPDRTFRWFHWSPRPARRWSSPSFGIDLFFGVYFFFFFFNFFSFASIFGPTRLEPFFGDLDISKFCLRYQL